LTVYAVRLKALPVAHEYACLMVRAYKTAETKKTDYPVKVRPMPGMWVQSVPVTAIPWVSMNTEKRILVIRSIRKDD
jgi:hypothetical protein